MCDFVRNYIETLLSLFGKKKIKGKQTSIIALQTMIVTVSLSVKGKGSVFITAVKATKLLKCLCTICVHLNNTDDSGHVK